jgi:hypothetical protein
VSQGELSCDDSILADREAREQLVSELKAALENPLANATCYPPPKSEIDAPRGVDKAPTSPLGAGRRSLQKRATASLSQSTCGVPRVRAWSPPFRAQYG